MMLVLTRRAGESIVIGKDIVITLVEVRPGGLAVLGVEAPREVPVDRQEVRERREQQKHHEAT